MNAFLITNEELIKAKEFFASRDIDSLKTQCYKINKSQPNFTVSICTMELDGLSRIISEDILESIFIIYYIHTELRNKRIKKISSKEIKKNIKWFADFVNYFNMEHEAGSAGLDEIKFLRDDRVICFAFDTMLNLFGDYKHIPKVVLLLYFAILKAIEIGAENSTNK